jgi:transcriptional regulator with PAS, ATPase and Fis domain
MKTSDASTTTISEVDSRRRGRAASPVLLVGSFVPQASRVVGLDRPLTLGRGSRTSANVRDRGADVILHSDYALSRGHLKIDRGDGGGWRVEDLGSKNGTLLDGRRVKTPTPLSEGNIVLFGSHAAVFRRASADQLAALEQEAADPFGPVATQSPALALTLAAIRRLAAISAETHLLFVGETGVGKEIYARAVHVASRRPGEFVAVNCAALPDELVESELFGYARGAHSTATRAKQGLIELADQGTLLLDEIGDMPPQAQVKLFRFLQDRKVMPLGSTRARAIDVRVVAATSKLSESLRSDLIGRFGAEPITIPPLRERPEDIGALAAHFGGKAFAAFEGMEPPAFRGLCLYHWPRNVRELEEVVKRAVALADGRPVRLEDLPAHVREAAQTGPRIGGPPREYRKGPTRVELERLLREKHGNVAAVAKALNRRWVVVKRWLDSFGLDADGFRG